MRRGGREASPSSFTIWRSSVRSDSGSAARQEEDARRGDERDENREAGEAQAGDLRVLAATVTDVRAGEPARVETPVPAMRRCR